MGNSCGCCSSSGQAPASPGAKFTPSLESIIDKIKDVDAIEQIDPLIDFIEKQLNTKKASSIASTSSSYHPDIDQVESVASRTTLAAQIINWFSNEAEQLQKSEIANVMGSTALKTVKAVGELHWVFVGLSMAAYAVERYIQVKSNEGECKELLDKIGELARDLKKFREAMPAESDKLWKAVNVIAEGAVMCCDFFAKGNASRYWSATTLEKQLQKTKESIRDITPSLTLTAVTHIARKLTRRSDPLPRNLLEFQPVGIDKQVSEVKELLDMEGAEQAVAVILCGFGGVGKTTLAASVIEQLDLSSSNFKFCRVIIDEKTPDETSHVVELQKNIILDFGGDKMDLRNPADGRNQIQNVMENKCCFLFIDNVVNSDCIKQLLPTDLLPHKQNTDLLPHKQSMEKTDSVKQKVRILITSRTSNPRAHLKIKKVEEYAVKALSNEAANLLLRKTILQDENELRDKFDEEGLMNDVAEACKGVPLLLSVFGSQLRLKREEGMYNEALQALQKGDLDSFADEEHLGQKLLFVYHKMNEEAQEAFLDICVYFHGRMDWNNLRHTVGETILEILHSRILVTRSESGNNVIVHDILRLMGRKEAKDTRLTDYKDLSQVLEDESKLKSVKGIELNSETSLTTLESRHLNAMHHSLRVLILGNWVKLDGPPCDKAFKNLRYLRVGDLPVFPFKDASKLEKLSYFYNKSKAGMNLSQLPPALKILDQDVPSFDCDAFEKLQLQNLKVLELFSVRTLKAVKLPEGLKLPASLKRLYLRNCKQVPERFGHLSALDRLILDKCDIDVLPQGFGKLAKLSYLSMEFCRKLTSFSEGFGSFSSLTYLSLRGCTSLKELPADLAALTALEELNVGECENLRALPDEFGGLSSLQNIILTGCIRLQRLPDSFGTVGIKSLNLHSLQSLQELPQNIGNLPCLLDFTLISCNSLASLPDSFVELEMLETLTIKSCIKLADLPNDFGRLRSLKKMTVEDCFSMKELPHGFQALPNLEILTLKSMSSLLYLPAGFWELACLENLIIQGLLLSSLPAGFGKLKRLNVLWIWFCPKLETLPDDFENLLSLRKAQFACCSVLEGAAMEKIVKLQKCYVVYIARSSKLIEQWKEMQQKEEHCAMVVNSSPSRTLDMSDQEWQRAAKVNLFRGKCVEVNSTTNELITHPSMSIDKDTTVAVIGLPICIPLPHTLLQRYVGMAMERSRTASSGQLRMIYARKAELVGQRAIDEDESIREVLMLLPQGCSYAIPSADTRRLSVINYLFFNFSADDKVACFMVDIKVDDKGHEIFVDGNTIIQDDISGKIVQYEVKEILPEKTKREEEDDISRKIVQDEVKENLPDIREDIKCIYEKRKREEEEEGGQSSHLQKKSMESTFAQVMKKSQIHHFIDSKKNTVTMDQLEGKTVGLIMCGFNTPECVQLQNFYKELKSKDINFEWIWIPLSVKEDYGFGAYSRAIESMPWGVLPNPKSVNIKDKSACFIVFDKEGEIVSQNVLSLVMSWGANACPFTQSKIKEISSNMRINSSLEFLLAGMDFINPQGVKVEKEHNNRKLIFLYAEPPSDKLKMMSMLEKLVQIYEEFEILYIGYFCNKAQEDVEALEKIYENATQTMRWPKLSFWDMITFWHRCMYLSNEDGEQLNSFMTIKSLVKNLYIEKRWLVFLDRDGVVTVNGREVVEMVCKSNDENTSKMNIVVNELISNLKSGKCPEIVKTFFKDELSNYPKHPQHPLFLADNEGSVYCPVCYSSVVCGPNQRRVYRCKDCNWGICGDCWEVFAQKQLQST